MIRTSQSLPSHKIAEQTRPFQTLPPHEIAEQSRRAAELRRTLQKATKFIAFDATTPQAFGLGSIMNAYSKDINLERLIDHTLQDFPRGIQLVNGEGFPGPSKADSAELTFRKYMDILQHEFPEPMYNDEQRKNICWLSTQSSGQSMLYFVINNIARLLVELRYGIRSLHDPLPQEVDIERKQIIDRTELGLNKATGKKICLTSDQAIIRAASDSSGVGFEQIYSNQYIILDMETGEVIESKDGADKPVLTIILKTYYPLRLPTSVDPAFTQPITLQIAVYDPRLNHVLDLLENIIIGGALVTAHIESDNFPRSKGDQVFDYVPIPAVIMNDQINIESMTLQIPTVFYDPKLTIDAKTNYIFNGLAQWAQLVNGTSFFSTEKQYLDYQLSKDAQFIEKVEHDCKFDFRDANYRRRQLVLAKILQDMMIQAFNTPEKMYTRDNEVRFGNALWFARKDVSNPAWCLLQRLQFLLQQLGYKIDTDKRKVDTETLKKRFPSLKKDVHGKEVPDSAIRPCIIEINRDHTTLTQVVAIKYFQGRMPICDIFIEVNIPLKLQQPFIMQLHRLTIRAHLPALKARMRELLQHIKAGALLNSYYYVPYSLPHPATSLSLTAPPETKQRKWGTSFSRSQRALSEKLPAPVGAAPTGSPRAAAVDAAISPNSRRRLGEDEPAASAASASTGLTPGINRLGVGAASRPLNPGVMQRLFRGSTRGSSSSLPDNDDDGVLRLDPSIDGEF